MSRWSFVFRELGRDLRRHPGTALSAILSLTLLFVLFNMFWVAARSADDLYVSLVSNLQMEVFLPESVSDSAITRMSSDIHAIEGVRSLTYITREAAREELIRLVGVDLLAEDTLNPLPRSFVLTFKPEYLSIEQLAAIKQRLSDVSGSPQIQYGEKWLDTTEHTRGVIRRVGVIIGFFILLATLVSSTNNIRLMSRARAPELLQMQLLGAGRWFIALPFVIGGLLVSSVASVASWMVIAYGRRQLDFVKITISLPQVSEIVLFCAIAAALGALSGYYGVRRHLE